MCVNWGHRDKSRTGSTQVFFTLSALGGRWQGWWQGWPLVSPLFMQSRQGGAGNQRSCPGWLCYWLPARPWASHFTSLSSIHLNQRRFTGDAFVSVCYFPMWKMEKSFLSL